MKSAHRQCTQLDREKQQKETREYYTVWIIMMKKRYRSRREGEFVCRPTSLPPGGYGIIASVILILLQVI